MKPVVQVEELRKTYGGVAAMDGVSFEVMRDGIFGIVGPNGAGKTTTVECVSGMRKPDGGEIEVLGLDPGRHGDALRRSLAAAAPSLAGSRIGQRLLGTALWVMAPYVGMGHGWNPSDMIATIRAEDAFDIADRLGEIEAPTLLIAGDRDRNFGMELFERTAALIPDSRLIIYEGRGHGGTFTDRWFARDVVAFLKAKDPTVSAGKPYGSPRGAR